MTAVAVEAAPPADHTRLAHEWFVRALVVIVLLAGVVRVIGVETGTKCVLVSSVAGLVSSEGSGHCVSYNDAVVYRDNALLNVHGHWFDANSPTGPIEPTALHAPLFTLVLTPLVAIGIHGFHSLELVMSLLGCLTVAAVGLLGRRIGGPTIGLIAAALVAFDPMLWINDVVLMPEGLFALVVVGVILLAYRFHDDPSWRRAAALGAGIGVATLTRNEAIFTVAFMAIPLSLGATRFTLRERLARLACIGAVTLAVLAPWVAFNTARFHTVVFTNGSGEGLRLATCDDTFFDSHIIGLRSLDCLPLDANTPTSQTGLSDEVSSDRVSRSQTERYYKDHLGRAPTVVAVRLARFWGVYRPFQTVRFDDVVEQRGIGRSDVGIVVSWLLAPFALLGGLELYRRRVPLSPLLAWIPCASIVVAGSSPVYRFRVAADLGLVILAAIGIAAVWEYRAGQRPQLLPASAVDPEPSPHE